MTAPNTPQPGATVVPSALAERRRIWHSDAFGLWVYAVVEVAFALAVLGIVVVGR